MSFSFSCECGNRIEVAATDAGTSVACSCGRKVTVPRLSQLRLLQGKDAFESSTVDTIQRLIDSGELPCGSACAVSGLPTSDTMFLTVVCEQSWKVKKQLFGQRVWHLVLAILCLPIGLSFFLLVFLIDKLQRVVDREPGYVGNQTERQGHDTVVQVPLHVHRDHHQTVRRLKNQRKLRELLTTVPIYSQLLDEYPDAQIHP